MPLFSTQFLGAFNDSLFKQAVVLFVTYQLLRDPAKEFQFSAIAQALFILPFFLLSALSGQLADDHDKSRLIRIIKFAEIGIMIVGGAGIMLASKFLMLAAVFAMGVHSTFFGPIKYAILPQMLRQDRIFDWAEEGRVGSHGEDRREHQRNVGEHDPRAPDNHDPDFSELDDPD